MQTEESTCAFEKSASQRQSSNEHAEADNEDDDIPQPLTQRQQFKDKNVWRLIAIAIVAAMCGGALVYYVTFGRNNIALQVRKSDSAPNLGPNSAGLEKSCSLSELSEHLLQNKLGLNVMYVSLTSREAMPFTNLTKSKVPSAFIDGTPGSATITIFECEDDLSAKHGARASRAITIGRAGGVEKQKNLEEMVFSWGRFGFVVVDESIANRIKILLKAD